jgi:hypothetical protein
MTHLQKRQERIRICVVWNDTFTNEASKNVNACCVTWPICKLGKQELMWMCVVWHDTFTNEASKNVNACCETWPICKWGKQELMWMCVVWHDTFTNEAKKNENMCCVTYHIHKFGKKEYECVLSDMTHSWMRQERMRMCFVCYDPFSNEAKKNVNVCCVT